MSHIFFFSYASENLDGPLKGFFKDLCAEIASKTEWRADDERISFRDKHNLRLMETYQPAILDALQKSSVLVSTTSFAYIQKEYCGKEYFIFDQRRLQSVGAAGVPPPVILPVIWVPVDGGLPPIIERLVQDQEDMPELYRTKGLRYLKVISPRQYRRCVIVIAEAIVGAWRAHPNLPAINLPLFDDVPNAFLRGEGEDAVGPNGWLRGPDVANFVFAAGSSQELPIPPGRYGTKASDWRPYLPPVRKTIAEIAREAVRKQSLRYREIVPDHHLANELRTARERKNLTIIVADPSTVPIASYRQATQTVDSMTSDGTALLMPWGGIEKPWDDVVQNHVKDAFPITSQLSKPAFQAPIRSADELEERFDVTLTELRAALIKAAIENKPKTDQPPAQVASSF